MVAILYRYAQYKGYGVSGADGLGAYTDAASVSDWALEAMAWAVATGIITGTTDTEISPSGSATRAQVATILQRYIDNIEG